MHSFYVVAILTIELSIKYVGSNALTKKWISSKFYNFLVYQYFLRTYPIMINWLGFWSPSRYLFDCLSVVKIDDKMIIDRSLKWSWPISQLDHLTSSIEVILPFGLHQNVKAGNLAWLSCFSEEPWLATIDSNHFS